MLDALNISFKKEEQDRESDKHMPDIISKISKKFVSKEFTKERE